MRSPFHAPILVVRLWRPVRVLLPVWGSAAWRCQVTTDLIARIAQLQQELDEAQRVANNNYRLYVTAKNQRDELLDALKAAAKAFPDLLGYPVLGDAIHAAIAKAEGRETMRP